MPNFGSYLAGAGQGLNASQNYAAGDLALKAALQKMAQERIQAQQTQAAQEAQVKGVGQMATTAPQGPGGSYTQQQLAQFAQSNPQALSAFMGYSKPIIQGGYSLERIQQQQEGANNRNQNTVQGALERTQQQQAGANSRNAASNQTRQSVVGQQQTGANARNAASNQTRQAIHQQAVINAASTPEYKTAKAEFDQAKQDERAIERNYQMEPGKAYSDPQWMDARKRSMAAQQKMESIQSKAVASASAAPTAPAIPPEAVKQLKEGTITTFGNGQKWTLTNGKPTQVQ